MHFNQLFLRNVPHIIERIFLDYLDDHRDYETCAQVCSIWNNHFKLHFETRETTRRKIRSRKLVTDWLKREPVFDQFDLTSSIGGLEAIKGHRVSFVDANENDLIVVLTVHGQRKGLILRFELDKMQLLAQMKLEFSTGITNVQANRAFIFIYPHTQKAVILRRSTLERTAVDAQGIKRFSMVSSTAFKLMKKCEDSQDFFLRKLDLLQERIVRYRSVIQANPHMQRCATKSRVIAIDDQSLVISCRHGFVQLYNHQQDCPQWNLKAISYEANQISYGPFLLKDYVAVVFGCHLENARTEHRILIFCRKSGKTLKNFTIQTSFRIFFAASDLYFAFGPIDNVTNNRLKTTIFEPRFNKIREISTSIGSGFQNALIAGDRILILQSMVGTACQRAGELKILDLKIENPEKSERIITDLVYSGPLNNKLISLAGDNSFICQKREGLFRVTFE